jgi:hypothetical protein
MSNKQINITFLWFLLTYSCSILYRFNPASSSGIYPPSLVREWGGFYCPGCGTFRALHQFLHGNLYAAFALNPLLTVCLPYIIYWFVAVSLKIYSNINLPIVVFRERNLKLLVLTIVVYGIMRNIPFAPFSWLAPGQLLIN